MLVGWELMPLPNARPHSPSRTSGVPVPLLSVPRNAPLVGLKALIVPSPKLPTSRSLPNGPNPASRSTSGLRLDVFVQASVAMPRNWHGVPLPAS